MPGEFATTRLTPDRYLDLLHREGERLLMAAEGTLDRVVPTCDGWTVRDVVEHVGMVYGHKVAVLELGRRPEEGEWDGPPAGADEIQWCHGLLHRLAADLQGRPANDPAWTWWDADQSVGFWQRRMALETAVHRADVESASGAIGPVAGDLALDGIDEVLTVMLADAGVEDVIGPTPDSGQVAVSIGGTTVRGDASDLLLWLWGRRADDAVSVEGDAASLRTTLKSATQ